MSLGYHDYIRKKCLYLRNKIEKYTKSTIDQFRFWHDGNEITDTVK